MTGGIKSVTERLPTGESLDRAKDLHAAGRFAEAVDLYTQALVALASPDPQALEVRFRRAGALASLRRFEEAIEDYEAVLATQPGQIGATYGRGMAFAGLARFAEATRDLERVTSLRPDAYPAQFNLGLAYERSGQLQTAFDQFLGMASRFRADLGQHTQALNQAARVLTGLERYDEAETLLRQSLEANPSQDTALQDIARLRQMACVWPVVKPFGPVTYEAIVEAMDPVDLMVLTDDPGLQLALNARYAAKSCAAPDPAPFGAPHPRERLRVGYLSSDFREHPASYLLYDVFGLHDRSRVEVFSYYIGPRTDDAMNRHVREHSDHFVDLAVLDDESACRRIRQDEIDILVDLNGYTRLARLGLVARRPAPIIVNWLGFPASTGSPYHHYILADDWTVPSGDEVFFSEKVARLACYMPSQRARVVGDAGTRAEAGLPQDAFVFCCFNGAWKITPESFARWMTILSAVDGSVLWLLAPRAIRGRLREHARSAGVDGSRLIFADWRPNPEHLARYRLADLFLDTGPYGAHTTSSDALWMGTPVITLSGRSFASRVCGSLVRNAGLPELVFTDANSFIDEAIALARDSERLAGYRKRLVEGRDTCAVFDMAALVRRLETLYAHMWGDWLAGELPQPDTRALNAPLSIEDRDGVPVLRR